MFDYAAYLTAQENTSELALSALPDAPTVPYTEPEQPRRKATAAVRRGSAFALYRIADRLQPA